MTREAYRDIRAQTVIEALTPKMLSVHPADVGARLNWRHFLSLGLYSNERIAGIENCNVTFYMCIANKTRWQQGFAVYVSAMDKWSLGFGHLCRIYRHKTQHKTQHNLRHNMQHKRGCFLYYIFKQNETK